MTEHIENEKNKRLRSKFDFNKYGFYAVHPYIDAEIGFGCRKKLNSQDNNRVSGIGIHIPNSIYNDSKLKRKALYITATYGDELEEGIRIRSKQNFHEPLDLEFRNEFFYDIDTEKLYHEKNEISANELLLEVYEKHIKTTRPISGLFLRLKLRFWRVLLPWILKSFSSIFHLALLLISGDKYTYQVLFQEENLNGRIISSRMTERIDQKETAKESKGEYKKIDFFGNKVPQWPIIFYSLTHLSFWFLIKYLGLATVQIENFITNNFFLVLYVIVSFWLIETVLPFLLKRLIKLCSTSSFIAEHRMIKV